MALGDQIPTESPPNLLLPESVRQRIYRFLEYTRDIGSDESFALVMNSSKGDPLDTISKWSSTHRRFNQNGANSTPEGQPPFSNQLFYVSRQVSQDARHFFYSLNRFRVYGMGAGGLSVLTAITTVTLQSLRNLQVEMSPLITTLQPSLFAPVADYDESPQVIDNWKATCRRLAHAPSQLNLSIHSSTATVRSAKAILEPLLDVQLKNCLIRLGARSNNKLQLYVEYVVLKATERSRNNEQSRAFHRFGDLPTELKIMVLEHTDLLPDTGTIAQDLWWDSVRKSFFPFPCARRRCDGPTMFNMACKATEVSYSSSKRYWSLPKALFQTSKSMRDLAKYVFYGYGAHHFAIPIPSTVLFGSARFERKNFLNPFPPDCIQYLHSIQLNFPQHVGDDEFQPHSVQALSLADTVNSLREHANISNIRLSLHFFLLEDVTVTFESLHEYANFKRIVEIIGPQMRELKDFFIHIVSPGLDADQRKAMEQALERIVKGEQYDSETCGKQYRGFYSTLR
ncbi:uncharacterized protein N7496_003387 [Penicillium cataractarum]|uniref:Uncharacterized protein n=1 Tax=Penicillium cataractarum TaxID=2100454 RepID=A0A9W9SP96_9EURO|nr:uncharacterized protein N7496_003387 [Penicillium cataractarum]KAJ5380959.1 hypothetical protein N7496_003387 [Penicillium cataractarum]